MKTPTHMPAPSHRAGFTLVELAIAGALFAVILGSVALVAGSSERTYRTESVHSQLEAQAGRTMQQVCEELRMAGIDTLSPAPAAGVAASSVQYVQAIGIENGVVQWTPLRRLELEYELGELDDGLDNNGNGLVDEGRLVLVEDPGSPNERRRVLTRWVAELLEGELANGLDDNGNGLVDERGFSLEGNGRAVTVRFTLERRTNEGALLRRTANSSVRPRNVLGGGP
jgi:hypothetical protein